MLEIWAEVNFDSQMTSKDKFFRQPLWHNCLIKIANKPVFFKDWCTNGIIMVKHLLGQDNNTFLSLKDFRSKYGFDPPPLGFYGLISAVKSLQTKSNFQDVQDTKHVHEPLSTKIFQVQKSITLIYKKLINNKSATPVSSQKKWIEDCCLPTNDNINWTTAYVLTKKSTKSTKLIEFQYKFLHRRIPTNKFSM